jgi:hypothetical protein
MAWVRARAFSLGGDWQLGIGDGSSPERPALADDLVGLRAKFLVKHDASVFFAD